MTAPILIENSDGNHHGANGKRYFHLLKYLDELQNSAYPSRKARALVNLACMITITIISLIVVVVSFFQ